MIKIKKYVLLSILILTLFVIPKPAFCDVGLAVTYPHAFYFPVPPGTIINGSDLYMKLKNIGDETLMVNITADPPNGIEVHLSTNQIILKPGREYVLRFWLNVTSELVPDVYSFKIYAAPVATVSREGGMSAIAFPAYAVPVKVDVSGLSYSLVIRAVDPGGSLISDALIRLFVLVDDSWNQLSEQKGILSLKVIPGTYRVVVMRGGKIWYDETFEVNNDTSLDVLIKLMYFQSVDAGLSEGKIVVRFYFVNEYKHVQNVILVYERDVDGEPLDSGLIATLGDLPVGMYGPYTIVLEPKYGKNTIKLKAIVGTVVFAEATVDVNVPKPHGRNPTWIDILTVVAVIVLVPLAILAVKKKVLRRLKSRREPKRKS
ncbi:MAG: hypothetical protein DRJ03_10090 [Chloroflexi bacterium]|nr:MAG: hypothetical protein DRJ03_10090 [Chloroflexota bacterium]